MAAEVFGDSPAHMMYGFLSSRFSFAHASERASVEMKTWYGAPPTNKSSSRSLNCAKARRSEPMSAATDASGVSGILV